MHTLVHIVGVTRPIISEENSIEVLGNYLENLDLENLIGLNCVLDLEAREEGKNLIKVLGENPAESQEIVNKWLESHSSQTIAPPSIRRIIISNLEGEGWIEVASIDLFSESESGIPGQEASSFQMPFFKDQLKRSVQEKISRGQRKPNEPCIIIIQTRRDIDWQYQYEIDYKELQELKGEIAGELEKTHEISGVILFYSDLYNGMYIENKNANKFIRIQRRELENARILQPRNLPLIDEDMIMVPGEEYGIQLEKIKKCFSVQREIILKDDKISLLRNIDILLKNENVENIHSISRLQYTIYTSDP